MSQYDVVVVGGGPGGCAAAKTAAEAGLRTVILERGNFCGEKNSSGFGLSPKAYRDFDYVRNLDLASQRTCVYGTFHVVNVDDVTEDGLYKDRMSWTLRAPTDVTYPYAHDFMVQMMSRADFDKWHGEVAVKAGADLQLRTKVENVIKDNGRVIGVVDDKGQEYRAPVVIAADGAHSITAQKAGLRYKWDLDDMTCLDTIDFKADPELIDKYCTDVGVHVFMGRGIGGYIVIYKDGIHLGSGPATTLAEECRTDTNFHAKSIRDNMKIGWLQHLLQCVRAEPREYQSHFLPWLRRFPENIYADGLMVVGDAAGTPEPFMAEGVYQAMYSGRLAAEWGVKAHREKDFSKRYLKQYMEELKASPIGVDFMSGGTLRDLFRQFMSQDFYDFFDAVADSMFYGMITMAEPHAIGMGRIPGILWRKRKPVRFMTKHYRPIVTETYKYRLSQRIRNSSFLPSPLASVVDLTRRR
jgi:electron transfer flavoprotein-quinone oxidoreductase